MSKKTNNGNGKKHVTAQSLNAAVKSICDIMRRSNVAGAMNYVPELTWILFLRILDEREAREAEEAEALGLSFAPSLTTPCRWQDRAFCFGRTKRRSCRPSANCLRNATFIASSVCLAACFRQPARA